MIFDDGFTRENFVLYSIISASFAIDTNAKWQNKNIRGKMLRLKYFFVHFLEFLMGMLRNLTLAICGDS